jgi:hypothetical protein
MGRPQKYPDRGFARTCLVCGKDYRARSTTSGSLCSHACRMKNLQALTTTPLVDRFWGSVQKGDGCWEWTGATFPGMYGKLYVLELRKEVAVHRVSWEIHFGPIPEGMLVCHTCDNRLCVRPEHLFLGTNAENMADMVQKARASRGEARPTARLTAENVVAIRTAYAAGGTSHRLLGEEYGVSETTIRAVISRAHWRHVP